MTRKLFELEYCNYGEESSYCNGMHHESFPPQSHLVNAYAKPWWFVDWCMSCLWKHNDIRKLPGKMPYMTFFKPSHHSSMHIQLQDEDVPLCGHRLLPKTLEKNTRISYREMEEENDIPISKHWNRLFRRNKRAEKVQEEN